MNTQLLIAAGGMGRRLGLDVPKALAPVGPRRLLVATLECLSVLDFHGPILIVIPEGHEAAFRRSLDEFESPVRWIAGGVHRQESVRKGLDALEPDTDVVVIHDAARPFAPGRAVMNAIESAARLGAATLATPVSDTILVADDDGCLVETPDRSCLWACQTPQVFRVDVIRKAHDLALSEQRVYTDDATMVRQMGYPVKLVDGGPMNFKITTKRDLAFAAHLLGGSVP